MIRRLKIKNQFIFIGEEKYFFVTFQQKLFVIPDKCPHRGGPLSLGIVCEKSSTIECPWHNNRFKIHRLIKRSPVGMRVRNVAFIKEEQ